MATASELKGVICKADDRSLVEVGVPEWTPDTLYLRPISGRDRDDYEQALVAAQTSGKRVENLRALLVAKSLCDSDNNRLFEDGEVALLGAKSGAVLDRLFDQVRKINGMADADIEEAWGN